MKYILFLSLLFCVIALPTYAELSPQDLDKIRLIVKEEVKSEIAPLNAKIQALDTRLQNVEQSIAWVRGKMEGFDKQLDAVNNQITHTTYITYGLIALIAVAIGIPQFLMTRRDKKDDEQNAQIQLLKKEYEQIQSLKDEIETLKQQRPTGS